MNTINLTVELGPETQKKLDQILEALQQASKHNCHKCVEHAVAMTKDLADAAAAAAPAPDPATTEAGHPVDEVSPHAAPKPVADPAPAAPKYTQADILAVVQRLIAPGSKKREKAKAIVNDYAVKISAIPEEKYNEVMDRLIALEKEG
jgi:predicted transcriptional regulator